MTIEIQTVHKPDGIRSHIVGHRWVMYSRNGVALAQAVTPATTREGARRAADRFLALLDETEWESWQ